MGGIGMKRTKSESEETLERYLIARGWLRRGVYPWEWAQRSFPGAHYVLEDAVALQRAADRAVGERR